MQDSRGIWLESRKMAADRGVSVPVSFLGRAGINKNGNRRSPVSTAVEVFTHRVRGNLFLAVEQTFHRRVVTRAEVIDS